MSRDDLSSMDKADLGGVTEDLDGVIEEESSGSAREDDLSRMDEEHSDGVNEDEDVLGFEKISGKVREDELSPLDEGGSGESCNDDLYFADKSGIGPQEDLLRSDNE